MRKLIVIALALMAQASAASPGADGSMTIFIAGDSTAQDFKPEKLPQMGWGMVLKCSLAGPVRIDNRAQGGRSARSFREEGWMADIGRSIREGDVLLIQFGHNDKAEQFPERYTPVPAFRQELAGYVAMARSHGAQPVLITPISKAQFGWDTLYNAVGEYADATRAVAAQTGTPLIDLNADTQAALLSAGPDRAKTWYLPDATHLTETGARMAASLVALRLGALGLPVSAHVKLSITANAAELGKPDCPPRSNRP